MKKFTRPQRSSGKTIPTSGNTQSSRSMPTEFLTELQSAASMIMSREECLALQLELEQLRNPRIIAA